MVRQSAANCFLRLSAPFTSISNSTTFRWFQIFSTSVFIAPPSKESLINRLKNRGTEDAKSLKARIKRSEEELTYSDKFDKVVVNKDFDTAYMRVKNHVTNFLAPQTQHVH